MTQKSTERQRVLYIITKSVWGGAARYVFDLATNLSDEFSVSVAGGGREKFYQVIAQTNIPYFNIPAFQREINIFKEILSFFEILGLLFQIKPNIIHVNSSKAGGVAGVAGKIYQFFSGKKACPSDRRVRLIFTAHGWAINEDRPDWQIKLIEFFSRLTCLFYDKIICVSEYDRQTALKNNLAPEKKLVTIHNGIDFAKLNFLPKEEAQEKLLTAASAKQPISGVVIGSIAEWTKNKGLAYLLKAVKRAKIKNARVILIGSGENPDKEKMRRLIEKYQLKNIHLIEWIDHAASYLKAFDTFVLPSLKEGLPYTLIEAMAAKVPVIATNVGGVPEMIENGTTGVLIQPKNSRQLAEKILDLINNPGEARELAEKAKAKAENDFSFTKMKEKTLGLYRDLLG